MGEGGFTPSPIRQFSVIDGQSKRTRQDERQIAPTTLETLLETILSRHHLFRSSALSIRCKLACTKSLLILVCN